MGDYACRRRWRHEYCSRSCPDQRCMITAMSTMNIYTDNENIVNDGWYSIGFEPKTANINNLRPRHQRMEKSISRKTYWRKIVLNKSACTNSKRQSGAAFIWVALKIQFLQMSYFALSCWIHDWWTTPWYST